MAILNRVRQLRIEHDNVSQARLAVQIDVSRQTLEAAHRIADVLECSMDDVSHYESEFPAQDDDDGLMTITVCIDDYPEWWKSDDVSRVTTRA